MGLRTRLLSPILGGGGGIVTFSYHRACEQIDVRVTRRELPKQCQNHGFAASGGAAALTTVTATARALL
jgi:hypothetical protein